MNQRSRAELAEAIRPFGPGGRLFDEHMPAFRALADVLGLPPDEAPPAPVPAMRSTYDRAALEAELVRDEGERLQVYRCTAGKRTIGVGRNLDDVGISGAETRDLGVTLASAVRDGITRGQSRGLLANDIARCEADLDSNLPWWRRLTDARQRVLLNMCFNLGIRGLLGFKNTLRMIDAGDYRRASTGMLNSLWARQVGARAIRLAKMMADGR